MIRVAIVEDDEKEANDLENLLIRYGEENKTAFDITIYTKPLVFLSGYKANFDIVFFDVEMPACNGIDAASEIRKSDKAVAIVFVTHMAQYAAKGYKVDAIDYVVKPLEYKELLSVMERVERRLAVKRKQMHVIRSIDGVSCVDVSEIMYVEVLRHKLSYHMVGGEILDAWGTLLKLEEELPRDRFVRCNSCYMVNLQYVTGVKGDSVLIGKEKLRVSRSRKQQFISALVAYAGE